MPLELRLESAGLHSDNEAIIGYLQNGFPTTAKWPDDNPIARYNAISNAYHAIDNLIAIRQFKASEPALRTLVRGPLPPPLHEAFVAKEAARPQPSADLAFAVEAETMLFRSSWAYALAKLGDATAIDIIKDQIQSATPTVHDRLSQMSQGHLNAYVGAYARFCSSLAGLGDKDGVQYLIATLPSLGDNPESIVMPLRLATGQNFGPDYDLPQRLQDAEKQKWYAWWAENKTDFRPRTEYILNIYKYWESRPAPVTVRDRVDVARGTLDRPTDSYISPQEEKATLWLADNAKKVAADLKRIINNPDERLSVRVKAMMWYAHGIGSGSLPQLKKYVQKNGADKMATEAKALVLEYCPRSRLAKRITEERAQ